MNLSAPMFRLKRQARLLSRQSRLPLHAALDQVARSEGYRSWSHLASRADHRPASEMLDQLRSGDLVLLGARPGHGKTLLGLELAAEAARRGTRSFFFTLEDNDRVVWDRLDGIGGGRVGLEGRLVVDSSDEICADYIIGLAGSEGRPAFIVVDYLQILDQRRVRPEADSQLRALRAFAAATRSIVVMLSQVDRAWELSGKARPALADVRAPNPIDLSLFTKSCFLHDGEAQLQLQA